MKLEQLEAENLARKHKMEQIRQDIERLEVLKQALVPDVSLTAQGTIASDSKMNTAEEVKLKRRRAKKAVKAKKPAVTKKPKRVAAKKPAATQKSHKKAKKPAAKKRTSPR